MSPCLWEFLTARRRQVPSYRGVPDTAPPTHQQHFLFLSLNVLHHHLSWGAGNTVHLSSPKLEMQRPVVNVC